MLPSFLLLAAPLLAADAPLLTLDEWIHDWKVTRDFTIAVAERMPAEHYSFRPAAPQLGFGAQMLHMAGSMVSRFEQVSGIQANLPEPKSADKDTVLKTLRAAFDYALGVLPKITPPQWANLYRVQWQGRPEASGRQIILNMFMHTAHHRAQCEVYMRLKGIEPPYYTF